MIDTRYIYAAALLNIVGMAGYVVNTLRGQTSPNRVTWTLWATAPLIAFFAQVADGVGLRSATTLMAGLGPLFVVLASFTNPKSYWRLGPLDWACGGLSVTTIIAWTMTGSTTLAITLSIVADGLAAAPTLVKAYRYPETENWFTYVFGLASSLITLATIDRWTISFFAFPAYLAMLTLSLSLLSTRRFTGRHSKDGAHGSTHLKRKVSASDATFRETDGASYRTKLTATESEGLTAEFNLADAHVHQEPSRSEWDQVLGRLTEIFVEASTRSQAEVDRAALLAFMSLSGQTSINNETWFLPTYSSSVTTEIVAHILDESRIKVALVEPTFDSIPDILRRHSILLRPITLSPSADFADAVLRATKEDVGAIYIVSPNNPSGHVLSRHDFVAVAGECQRKSISLILDTSFRLHDDRAVFDQYEVLEQCGVNYIAIEDTGKIWPTLDLKLSFLLASPIFRQSLLSIHNDFLLNVSPFISRLVQCYSEFSIADRLSSVRSPLVANRHYLRAALAASFEEGLVVNPNSNVGVEFIRRPVALPSTAIVDELARRGVAILSGRSFYWSNGDRGEEYLRVALARSPEYFARATDRLVAALGDLMDSGHRMVTVPRLGRDCRS